MSPDYAQQHRRFMALSQMLEALYASNDAVRIGVMGLGREGQAAVGYIEFSPAIKITYSNAAMELNRRGLYRPQDFARFYEQAAANPAGQAAVLEAARACGLADQDVLSLASEGASPAAGAPAAAQRSGVDVVIIVAMRDELRALKAVDGQWQRKTDPSGFPYEQATLSTGADSGSITVVVAQAGAMGASHTAARAQALVSELSPRCLAMCGICAGYKRKTDLGDVIVAQRVFNYNAGKQHAGGRMSYDIQTFNLAPQWKLAAEEYCDSERWRDQVDALRAKWPASIPWQREAILRDLFAMEQGAALQPPASRYPDWSTILSALLADELVELSPPTFQPSLTDTGREWVSRRLVFHSTQPSPSFRAHIAPIAVGGRVVEDEAVFDEIRKYERKAIGLEMELTGLATIAESTSTRSLMVKAVSDFADGSKNDDYRDIAAEASARCLLGLLKELAAQGAL